jgi:hypothetical protein
VGDAPQAQVNNGTYIFVGYPNFLAVGRGIFEAGVVASLSAPARLMDLSQWHCQL